jgi:hypothetical protein
MVGARWMRFLLTCIPASVLFCLAATYLIDVPGVYMDAVNPDYMVIHILHPQATNIPASVIPGSMLGGRFPILGQIYQGALVLYVGLPVYWLFGTGVEGIRLANLVFGLIVLAAAAAFLRAWNIRPWIWAVALFALALDPAFLFAWRTQFYIALLPMAPLLLSAALTRSSSKIGSRRTAMLAGLLAGIACYGYFFFGFLVPAVFLYAWIVSRRTGQASIIWWLAGFVLGAAPYLLAAALLWQATGGTAGFVSYMRSALSILSPGKSQLAFTQRLALFVDYARLSVLGAGPKLMMLGESSSIAPGLRLVLLLGFPLCGLALSAFFKTKPPGLLLLAGVVIGLLALTLAFGDRLWLQHFAVLVPVLYLALASVLEAVARLLSNYDGIRASAVPALLVFGLLLTANAADAKEVFSSLERTGGVGYYSDAIDQFATDSLKEKDPTFYFFPDWGVSMSFVMLTHGTLPYSFDFDARSAHTSLCNGQDIAVALLLNKDLVRLRNWTEALGRTEPVVSTYRQRNGAPVLTVARWKASPQPAHACSR